MRREGVGDNVLTIETLVEPGGADVDVKDADCATPLPFTAYATGSWRR